MAFDPKREPVAPRQAASVILVRGREPSGEVEVFLLRRHRKASFMSSAFVFPGGAAEPDETDLRATAARELFEEAGVLVCEPPVARDRVAEWRARAAAGEALEALLPEAGTALALDRLHYFAHWITPSAESKRFSARFFVAELPAGQTPSFDATETVDEIWVTPREALARAGELRLPPPQVRTFGEMAGAARGGVAALRALAARRAERPHPILPRFAAVPDAPKGFCLLLPWDPEYVSRGTGDAIEMAPDHPLAVGPSRFILDDDATWKNIDAPGSPSAA
jgi:8-oxo-dGTP pyrophosphatase MutT (NUDIX family)